MIDNGPLSLLTTCVALIVGLFIVALGPDSIGKFLGKPDDWENKGLLNFLVVPVVLVAFGFLMVAVWDANPCSSHEECEARERESRIADWNSRGR